MFPRSIICREKLYKNSMWGLWTNPTLEGTKTLATLNPHHKSMEGGQELRKKRRKSDAPKLEDERPLEKKWRFHYRRNSVFGETSGGKWNL